MHIVSDTTRRAAGVAAAAAALLGGLSACGGLKAYFPSRDEVFKPVPVTLGEERVAGGDTSYVLAGRGYRVVTHDRDLLPDAKTSLDRAAFAFRRFMAAEPPVVDVRLQVASRRGRARADTAHRAGSASPAAADSGRVVTMVAWRDDRGGRRGDGPIRASLPTVVLVHRWLSAMTDSMTHTTAARVVGTVADTSRAPRRFGVEEQQQRSADDPRIPDWIEQAIPALVAGSPDPEFASAQLARQKDKLIPLRTLLAERRPEGGRDRGEPMAGGLPPERGGEERGEQPGRVRMGGAPGRGPGGRLSAIEGRALFDDEAVSVAAYLAEREGSEFVGNVFRTLVGGGTLEDALRGAHGVAHDLDSFEQGWRGWLDSQAGKVEEERGSR